MRHCSPCDPSCGACDGIAECPECGFEHEPGYELNDDTVYVCSHCGTELVVRRAGYNEMQRYWGEFWEECEEGNGKGIDNAPRVTLGRVHTQRADIADAFKAMFTDSMRAAAGLGIRSGE